MKNIGSVFLIIVLALVLLIVAGKLLPVKGAPENSSGPDSGNALQKGTEQITEGIVGGTGGGILNGIGGIEADILAGLGGIFKSLFGGPPAPGAARRDARRSAGPVRLPRV